MGELFGPDFFGLIGLGVLIISGFAKLEKRLTALEVLITCIEKRVENVEARE